MLNSDLNAFLANVEVRALRMAEFATHNREDALDIVQDTMMALVRRYADKMPDAWPALFHRILQNRIRDWHRRHAIRSRYLSWFGSSESAQQVMDKVPGPPINDPFYKLGMSDAGKRLIEALQNLPLRQQQVFMLRAWEGLDVRQAARAMGCSEGSVKTHYHRANQRLQEALEGYWP
ncbi:MAG: RNA polymerase sigma factor [Mariprofundaceae bacterium]